MASTMYILTASLTHKTVAFLPFLRSLVQTWLHYSSKIIPWSRQALSKSVSLNRYLSMPSLSLPPLLFGSVATPLS